MAIWYIDPQNGSDGNTGSSWAQAWGTINGATAAKGVAPGDTVRIAKSPDPTSLGQTAQWTYGSRDVVLQTGTVTANINLCETAWTASADVTCTADSSIRKQGSYCAKNAVAAAFTTGKAASKATGLLDLSAYQQISFWIRASVAVPAGALQLKLCSDTAGDTPVNTFTLPALPGPNYWQPLTLDNGSALGNAIQSVALYVVTDFGAVDLYLDNILACKAPSSPDSLTLTSLISKNSQAQGGAEGWYALQSINGVTLKIDNHTNCVADTYGLYAGSSETVTLYKRETFSPLNCQGLTMVGTGAALVQASQISGVMDNLLVFSGGWDSALGIQNGETLFDGLNGLGNGLDQNSKNYNKWDHLNAVRYFCGYTMGDNNYGNVIDNLQTATACTMHGVDGYNYSANFSILNALNLNNNGNYGVRIYCSGKTYKIASACGNFNGGIMLGGSLNKTYHPTGINLKYNYFGSYIPGAAYNKIINPIFANNVSNYSIGIGWFGNKNYIINPTFQDANILVVPADVDVCLVCQNVGGIVGNHQMYLSRGIIKAQTVIAHSPGGTAWQFSPTSAYCRASWPLSLKVAEIAVNANKQVAVKAWMRRTHTDLTFALVCRGGQISGVPDDVIASMTAAADTWEEVALSFTPTEAGVVEIEVWAYGGTTYSGFVDDLTLEQAA